MPWDDELPQPLTPLQEILRRITERLACELAQPSLNAPDWSPTEWQLARAVAVIHCVSPLLARSLRWDGPAHWREFLAGQRAHVAARHGRIQQLLDGIDCRARGQGIALLGLKGAALHSMGLYRAGERPMADVDLLVRPPDAIRTRQVLQSLGFDLSFANWRHEVFVPPDRYLHQGMGEHRDNYLKVELHTRIAEKLPLRIADVTDLVSPRTPHPGLNLYPSNAALMIHLLIHAARSMITRDLRLLQLHDIALVSSRMARSDWDELLAHGGAKEPNRAWWALPPLQLTARYFPDAVPPDVVAALADRTAWVLQRIAGNRRVSDVSMSYPWIEAFPGIAWSRSIAELVEYIRGRIWPDAESLRQRNIRVETDFVASRTQWCQLSQRQRMLRWLTSRPLRAETLHAVRMALSEAL